MSRTRSIRTLALLAALVALVAALLPASTVSAAIGENILVSAADDGTQANAQSVSLRTTPDGRYAVFWSDASNLDPLDPTGPNRDTYLKDTQTGDIELISVAADGTTKGNQNSENGDVSDDGRYVVFRSNATNLHPSDTTNDGDVFRKDRQTGAVDLVSVDGLGVTGTNTSARTMAISGDGNLVVFETRDQMVPEDTEGQWDIYLKNMTTGAVELISVLPDGTPDNSATDAYNPDISADGRYITYTMNNVFGNSHFHTFLYDTVNNTRTHLSRSNDGTLLSTYSWEADVSDNGNFVTFDAQSDIGFGTPVSSMLYLYDVVNDTRELISKTEAGAFANNNSRNGSITADGRWVYYQSTATNLDPADTSGNQSIYRYDRTNNVVELVSVTHDGAQADNACGGAHVATDNSSVMFICWASNMIPSDANGANRDVFKVELATPPSFTSAAPTDGTINVPYTHDFTADGDTPITYEVTSGALPDGLSISGSQITGTPTVADTFTGTITATNDAGTDTQDFDITIGVPPSITSAAPADGTINVPYTHDFAATGNATITYEVTSGALPDGLSISGSQITGTPTAGGTFNGDVTATNAFGTDVQAFSIFIGTPPSFTSAAAPDGVLGTPYSHTLTADGDATITFSVSSGTLPDGLSLSGADITGTPTMSGTFNGEFTATNSVGSDTQAFSIFIATPPSITSAAPPNGILGIPYNHTLTADGDATITFAVTSGSLPSGLSLSGDTISGTPDTLETATGEFTATNAAGTDVQAFSITINPDNAAPVAVDDSYSVVGGQMLDTGAMGVLDNDTDVDMDSLTAILDTDVANGTLLLNSDGSFTYTPDFGFMGDDTFTYFANDGTVNSDSAATVTITVTDPAGTPPRLYPFNGETVTEATYQGPNFVFRHIEGVEWYQIWVGTDTDTTPVTQAYFEWHPANNDAPFADGQGICDENDICTIPGDIWIVDGNYSWWMTTWQTGDTTADINSNWDETKFTFEFGAPTNSFLLTTPADGSTIASAPTEFVWNHDPNVQWYQIWIGSDDYTNQIVFNWYDATELCEAGVCTLPVPGGASFGDGGYEGWAEEWGPGGYATWPMTANTTFTIDTSGAVPMQQPVPRLTR